MHRKNMQWTDYWTSFETTGRVMDNKISDGGKKYVSTPENVHDVGAGFEAESQEACKMPFWTT